MLWSVAWSSIRVTKVTAGGVKGSEFDWSDVIDWRAAGFCYGGYAVLTRRAFPDSVERKPNILESGG